MSERMLVIDWLTPMIPDDPEQGRRLYAQWRCVGAFAIAIEDAINGAGLDHASLAATLGWTERKLAGKLARIDRLKVTEVGEILWACGLEVYDLEVRGLGIIKMRERPSPVLADTGRPEGE